MINELCDVNSKFDKLTNYIINSYIDDSRFSIHICNYFDTIGIRSCITNHLEGFHRQLNARVQTQSDLWISINEIIR